MEYFEFFIENIYLDLTYNLVELLKVKNEHYY